MSLTVICSKWGDAYGPEYVNRLAHGVRKHLHEPYEFVCFTDDVRGVWASCLPIEEWWKGKSHEALFRMQGASGISSGYPNLYMFRRDFPIEGRILYFDLDVLITGSLDELVAMDEPFLAIDDWWSKNWNGSVMLFTAGTYPQMWDDFPPANLASLRNGQDWTSHCVPDGCAWPEAWVRSYKIHGESGPPPDCRVLVFHGRPKMDEFHDGHWITRMWKEA